MKIKNETCAVFSSQQQRWQQQRPSCHSGLFTAIVNWRCAGSHWNDYDIASFSSPSSGSEVQPIDSQKVNRLTSYRHAVHRRYCRPALIICRQQENQAPNVFASLASAPWPIRSFLSSPVSYFCTSKVWDTRTTESSSLTAGFSCLRGAGWFCDAFARFA